MASSDDEDRMIDNFAAPREKAARNAVKPPPKRPSTGSLSPRTARQFVCGNKTSSVLTHEGITIVVVKGSICDQTDVDAIAHAVGSEYDLKAGIVAKEILSRAGPKIQSELTAAKPKKPTYADVVATRGFNLKCSYVFHGICKQWNKGKDDAEKILRTFIYNILEAANGKKLNSVAIPAIGTGNLEFPRELVFDCLFQESDRFSSKNPDATIAEIRLVVFDQATVDVFEKKLLQLAPVPSSTGSDDDENDDDDDDDEKTSDDDDSDSGVNFFIKLLGGLALAAAKQGPTFQQLGLAYPDRWQSVPTAAAQASAAAQTQKKSPPKVPPKPSKPDVPPYHKVALASSDPDFKKVFQNIQQTAGASVKKILQIERIENTNLYQVYTVLREQMSKRNVAGTENERMLWHGTASTTLENILACGFNRSYCGKNAVLYGNGVYFARDFAYSAQRTYSPPDANGVRYIVQCRVLTGEFTEGKPNMKEPPAKKGLILYDSVVDTMTDPNMYVVFKDAQAYPEYLISFQ